MVVRHFAEQPRYACSCSYSETTAVKAAMGEHARLLHEPCKVHEWQSALHELLAVAVNG
jgi:hypothetical protein